MFGGLGHLTLPNDHEIESGVSNGLILPECLSVQTFVGLMFGASVPAATVELEYASTCYPIDGDTLNPTLAPVATLSVVDMDTTLFNFVLEPTGGDFARVLFGVEHFLVG